MIVHTSFCSPPIEGTIWESAEKLKDTFKLFYYALCTVYNTLHLCTENRDRCLAGSYRNCTPFPNIDDPLDLLKNLKGEFKIDSAGYCTSKKIYACAGAEGITINKDLINRSVLIYTYNPTDWMTKYDGVALFALIRQYIEHELAHMMNHQNGCFENKEGVVIFPDPNFDCDTFEKEPLHGESGFHVQEMAQRRASENPSSRHFKSLSLEIDFNGAATFVPPLEGKLFFGVVSKSGVSRPNIVQIVRPRTVEELQNYLQSYPKFDFGGQAGSRKRLSSSLTTPQKETTTKKQRNRASPIGTEQATVVSDMQPSVLTKYTHFKTGNSKQVETGSDWSDRNDGLSLIEDPKSELRSWVLCDISARFCDKNGCPRKQFGLGETVYAMIEFTNNTEKVVHIPMEKRTFGRGGIKLQVEGMTSGYTPCTGCSNNVVVVLKKGESYKFFRILCRGNKASANLEGIRYSAPDKPSTYTKTSLVGAGLEYPLSCTLRVVDREEVPEQDEE